MPSREILNQLVLVNLLCASRLEFSQVLPEHEC